MRSKKVALYKILQAHCHGGTMSEDGRKERREKLEREVSKDRRREQQEVETECSNKSKW
jgi:hypothetical protein